MTATEAISISLGRARARARLALSVRNAAIGIAALAIAAVVAYRLDRAFALDTRGRAASLAALALVGIVALVITFLVPRLRAFSDRTVAAWIERRFPELRERLISAVELLDDAPPDVSRSLTAAVASDAASAAAALDTPRAVTMTGARWPAAAAAIALAILGAHMALSPAAFSTWLRRIAMPAADIPVWANTRITVEPGDTVIPRGDGARLRVLTAGAWPNEARVVAQSVSGKRWERKLTRYRDQGSTRAFELSIPALQEDLTYRALAGDGRSNEYRIGVEDRPMVRAARVTLDYPAYMGRSPEVRTGSGADILAPIGTVAAIEIEANKPLDTAEASLDDAPSERWAADGAKAAGKVKVIRDGTLRIALRDRRGFSSQPHAAFLVRALRDRPPTASIIKPARDLERSPIGSVALEAAASDDVGIGSMALVMAARGRTRTTAMQTHAAPDSRSVRAAASLNLGGLGLKDGDIVTYRVEARDRNDVTGLGVGRSAEYRIRIVGLGEMLERAEADTRREAEALRRLVNLQRGVEEELRKARQDPARARSAATAQRDIARMTAELKTQAESASERMRDNRLASEAELARRSAMAAELGKLASGSMPQAASAMDRASSQPAALPDAAARALDIRAALQRLADAAGPPASPDQLAREAAGLAREQMELAEKSDAQAQAQEAGGAKPADLAALAQRQADLAARTRSLASKLDAAADASADPAMREAERSFRNAGVEAKQRAAQSSLQAGKPGQAAPRQAESASALRQLASQLLSGQSAQVTPEALERQAEALDTAADRLTDLANLQKLIPQAAERAKTREEAGKVAGDERNIQAALEKVVPALAPAPGAEDAARRAGGSMGRAASALSQDQAAQAIQPARQATRELLQAAIEARDAARQLETQADTLRSQRQFEALARDQRELQARTRAANARTDRQGNAAAQNLAGDEDKLVKRALEAVNELDSDTHKWMGWQATRRMEEARNALWRQDTGSATQRYQQNAAQTLDRLAASLEEQRMASAMQVQAGSRGSPEAQMAEIAGDVRAVREMQAQIRSETQQTDARRTARPDRALTEQEQRDVANLAAAEDEAQGRLRQASDRAREAIGDSQELRGIAERMATIRDALRARDTGEANVRRQSEVISSLDQILERNTESMSSSVRRETNSGQGQRQRAEARSTPGAGNAPVVEARPPSFRIPSAAKHRFGNLSAREQQLLQQGRLEKVPPEYRDLVSRYYKALSERR